MRFSNSASGNRMLFPFLFFINFAFAAEVLAQNSVISISSGNGLEQLSGGFIPGGHYQLTSNIDLSGKNWLPIGSGDSPFIGIFSGNGYIIKGLNVTSGKDDQPVGLFGVMKDSVVDRIIFTDSQVESTGKDSRQRGLFKLFPHRA